MVDDRTYIDDITKFLQFLLTWGMFRHCMGVGNCFIFNSHSKEIRFFKTCCAHFISNAGCFPNRFGTYASGDRILHDPM